MLGRPDDLRQVEAKYPALLFKQQLTAFLEKIYGMIRDSLKKEIAPLIGLCIQVSAILFYHPGILMMYLKWFRNKKYKQIQVVIAIPLLFLNRIRINPPFESRLLFSCVCSSSKYAAKTRKLVIDSQVTRPYDLKALKTFLWLWRNTVFLLLLLFLFVLLMFSFLGPNC